MGVPCALLCLGLTIGLLHTADALSYYRRQFEKSCSVSSQCSSTQCCLNPVPRRGKRDTSGDGVCSPRKALNEKCYVNNDNLGTPDGDTMYLDDCPCQEGLECQGTGTFEVPQGEIGVCVSSVKPCDTGKDCGSDECCVSAIRPIGRKKRSVGQCEKVGGSGDSCLVNYQTPQDFYYQCPCAKGYSCQGNGMYDIPLGETGTCESLLVGK